MTGIADIRAAVIGTGFIGTVHVEELRRIGVQVRGVLGSTPERGAARAAALGVGHAYPSLDAILEDPAVDVVHVTSPNHLHVAAGAGDPRRRQARRLREAARDDRRGVGRASSRMAARSGLVNAVNFNIRFYPLHQHVREFVADGGLGDVRFVTGHYFQDWLLLDTDWNWRLEPDKGGSLRAVGDIGSHWIDLVQFLTGRQIVAVMADLATFVGLRQEPQGPVETFSTERSADTVDARDADRGCRVDPAAVRQRRPRRRLRVADQRRSQELAPVGDRRLDRRRGLGLRDARPPVAGPPRPAERDPAPEPGADGPGRTGGVGAAGRPRRGLRRHVRGAVPGDLRGRRRRPSRRSAAVRHVRRRPRRDARERRDRRERGRRSVGRRGSRRRVARRIVAPAASPWRRPDATRLPDRAVPGHAADGGRRLGGRRPASRSSRSPAGRRPPARRGATPARATSTSRTSPPARRATSGPRSRPRASRSPGSASIRTRSIPTPSTGRRSSAT